MFLLVQSHLAWIQYIIWIKGLFDGPHNLQCWAQLFFYIRRSGKTGSMLSGNSASHLEDKFGKFIGRWFEPVPFILASHISYKGGVDISISNVPKGGKQ